MANIVGKTSSAETLTGTSGADTLTGGEGPNTLYGGGGADKFIVTSRPGAYYSRDVIMDFVRGSDKIDVSAYGISSFDQLKSILQNSPNDTNDAYFNAFFQGYEHSVEIRGVNVDRLAASDFIFSTLTGRTIDGSNNSDRIFGTTGNDTLKGLDGNDSMHGGLGADILVGGDETNTLYGGTGADKFTATARAGAYYSRDVIMDFVKGSDKIDVSAYGISSFDQLVAILQNSPNDPNDAYFNAFFQGYEHSIEIRGVNVEQLAASDFIFSTLTGRAIDGSNSNDRIFGTTGNDTLKGLDGNDSMFGGAGTDTLIGGDETNTLYGGTGVDKFTATARAGAYYSRDVIMDFRKGDKIDVSAYGISSFDQLEAILQNSPNDPNDAYFNAFFQGYEHSIEIRGVGAGQLAASDFILSTLTGRTIDGSNSNDRIFGTTGNDTLKGLDGNDSMFGGVGTDTLIGGDETNTLYGGTGVDKFTATARAGAYYSRDIIMDFRKGDKIDVSAFGISSFDQLKAILQNSPEDPNDAYFNAFFQGYEHSIETRGVGAGQLAASDFIFSTLTGRTIDGSNSNDRIFGTTGNDTLKGLDGNDSMLGGLGADTLIGGDETNTLYGGAGADKFTATARAGAYYSRDVIMDFVRGSDKIDISAYGISSFDQLKSILQNSPNDPNDAYFNALFQGYEHSIEIRGVGAGQLTASDFIFSTQAGRTIDGSNSNDRIFGTAGADVIKGFSGNDSMFGGAGADTLIGGVGNDVYYTDNIGDEVEEASGEGTDTVLASGSFVLTAGQSVETILAASATSTSALNLTGNALQQEITGNAGANVLDGKGGNDTLTGLAGKDFFVFSTTLGSSNVDRITDFKVADDTIRLENAIFKALTATGTLAASAFRTNTTGLAGDASDRIIYESDTGKLFYDANGTGSGAGIHFATLSTGLSLTNADFSVI